jgi:hypothetical protein
MASGRFAARPGKIKNPPAVQRVGLKIKKCFFIDVSCPNRNQGAA